jgi:hypothetical protein
MALRLAARRLLDGATFAEGRVHDSAIAPIDHMVGEKGEPFIIVSSEDESAKITAREVNGGDRAIDLVIEIAIAKAVAATPAAGDDAPQPAEIIIPSTDAGLEISLTLITRQINRALFETKGGWGDVFKVFCIGLESVATRRGVGNKDGGRFAARQMIFTIKPLDEPAFGHVPTPDEAWGKLIAAMEADVEFAPLAPLIKQTITGADVEPWDRGRSDAGLTDGAADRIGIGSKAEVGAEPPLADDGVLGDP